MEQLVQPKVRGFICITAHPTGCQENVQQQIDYVQAQTSAIQHPPKKVLVIGASTGYGLASRIAAAFGCGAATIGVFFERPASGNRTASAGWYNTAAFERAAQRAGLYAKSVNGDAFSDEIKQQVVELIKKDWGGEVDLIIYSIASPRRKDPVTGEIYNSVLKTIGEPYVNKNIDVFSGATSDITIEPATEKEIADTVAVMGGDDWKLWLEKLMAAKLLAPGVKTVAYDYIGPELTFPLYHHGSIGQAKAHVRQTAQQLTKELSALGGHAYVSVNKAVVTQASSAIPVVPLYMSLLFRIMKDKKLHEGCIEQMWRLFSQRLYQGSKVPVDAGGLIRIDDWEMRADVQQEVEKLWQQVETDNIDKISDLTGYRHEFHRLFGFEVKGIDYNAAIETDVAIPSVPKTEE